MEGIVFDKLFEPLNKLHAIAQIREEFYWIVNIAESTKPHCILEIGVEHGGSLKFWEQLLLPGDLLIGVDIHPDTRENIVWNWRKSNRDIHIMVGDSTDAVTVHLVREKLNGRLVDFLHIDGCHGHPDAGGKPRYLTKCVDNVPKKDFENYSPFVRSGGVVLVADLGQPCCYELWESLAGKKEKDPNIGHGAWFKP